MDFESQKGKIVKAARSNVPITIKTYTLPRDTELYLEQVLDLFLAETGQEQLKDHLSYCLRELTVNAKKANTKRVYFKEKGLDLANPKGYEAGIKNFKEETLSNINYWLQKQKEAGLYIKVQFQTKEESFQLAVKNNVEITRKEQMRVYDRIARSRAFNSMEEAFTEVLDDSEGAGLGIVIMVLMLKKMGLDEDAFDIDAEGGETIAKLTIPYSDIRLENLNELSKTVVDEIENLPQFPANIMEIQRLISDPESEIISIAKQISTDPSLTADLLKLVNSAQYVLAKRVDNIVEAVKIVGLRGLKNILYSYGTQKMLGRDTDEQQDLWNHSYRTAFFAYSLAKNLRKKREILDDAYVGGILHDMGKIVFSDVHPHLLEKIKSFNTERELPENIIEDLAAGLNHAEIGGLIAEKWNFPPPLVEAIRYHHEPYRCDPEYRDQVYAVYLANALTHYEGDEMSLDQIDRGVLEYFGIKGEEQLTVILQRLGQAFDKERDQK